MFALNEGQISSILQYFIIGTWVIVGLFVVIHFLIGLKRGTKKSLFYTISYVITLAIVLFLVSLFSIKMFFPTAGSLYNFLLKSGISEDNTIMQIVGNPELSPLVFATIDVFYKLILFAIFYPILSFILKRLVFRKIYKGFFEKEINTNVTDNSAHEVKPSGVSKIGGSLVGSVRGLITSFMFFLPLIVLLGITSGIKYQPKNDNLSALSNHEEEVAPSKFDEYLSLIDKFNSSSYFSMVKKVKLGSKSIDEIVFDFGFSGDIKKEGQKTQKLQLGSESRKIGEVANAVLELGFLEDENFYKTLSSQDIEKIKALFDSIGSLESINVSLPFALDYLVNIESLAGLDIKNNPNTKASFEKLKSVEWSKEVETLFNVIKKSLEIGTFNELQEMFKTPGTIIQNDIEFIALFGDVISEIGNLELFYGANIGLEYAIANKMLPEIKNNEDYRLYYEDKLSFMFANPSFFVNSATDGQFGYLGKMISGLGDEKHDLLDFSGLFDEDGKFLPINLLEEEYESVLRMLIGSIANFDLLTKSLPIGLDYFLYEKANGDTINMINDISELISLIDFNKEFGHVNEVYNTIIQMSLSEYLTSSNLIEVVDNVLEVEENFINVKKIINEIFVSSDIVNRAFEISSDFLLDMFIKNDGIKEYVSSIVELEEFKIGQEIVNVLELSSNLYQFSNIENVLTQFKNKDYIEFGFDLASLSEGKYLKFKEDLTSLQVLSLKPEDASLNIGSLVSINAIEIPKNMDVDDLTKDLTKVLDILYYQGNYMISEGHTKDNVKEVELSKAIDHVHLKESLTFDHVEDKNSILLHNIVAYAKKIDLNIGEFGSISTPEELVELSAGTKEWTDEINGILGSLISFIGTTAKPDELVLTINSLTDISKLGAPAYVNIFNRFLRANNEANIEAGLDDLDRFLTSRIIHTSLSNTLTGEGFETILVDVLNGMFETNTNYSTEPRAHQLDSEGLLKVSEIKNILLGTLELELVNDGKVSIKVSDILALSVDDTKFKSFFKSSYLVTLVSKIVLLDEFKLKISDAVKIDANDLTLDQLDYYMEDLSVDELHKLFQSLNILGITDFGNMDIGMNILKDLLEDQKLEKLLESNYFYQVISLMIIEQYKDLGILNLPDEVYGNYGNPYISKLEIRSLLEVFELLELEDTSGLDSSIITTDLLEELISKDSYLIRSLLSNELVKTINFPSNSFEDNYNWLLKQTELDALLEALSILEPDTPKPIDSIDMNNLVIDVDTLEALINIQDLSGGSAFINRTISTIIIETNGLSIPPNAYTDSNKTDLVRHEIKVIPNIFKELGITNIGDSNVVIDTKTLAPNVITNLLALNSLIINKTISDQITSLNSLSIPNDAYEIELVEGVQVVKHAEMVNLFLAIEELNIDFNNLDTFDPLISDINNIISANNKNSLIISRIISEGLLANRKENGSGILVIDDSLIIDSLDIKDSEIDILLSNIAELEFTNIQEIIDMFANFGSDPGLVMQKFILLQNMTVYSKILHDTFEDLI